MTPNIRLDQIIQIWTHLMHLITGSYQISTHPPVPVRPLHDIPYETRLFVSSDFIKLDFIKVIKFYIKL